MSIAERAVSWARQIAADPTHGYDQSCRWGVDYDCSSLVISAYKQAGLPLTATYTGDMYRDFTAHGFKDVTHRIDLNTGAGLEPGDVLLNHIHHTAMAIGNGRIVQASINELGTVTGGQRGDQTGREIYERDYYNYSHGWDGVLRYVGEGDETAPHSTAAVASHHDTAAVAPDSTAAVAPDSTAAGEHYPAPSYYYTLRLPLLKRGMKSPHACAVQRLLAAAGEYGGEISGVMDAATVTAVKLFQGKNALEADGEVGGLTWGALLSR